MNLKTIHIEDAFSPQIAQKKNLIGEYLLDFDIDYTDRVGIMNGLSGVGLLLSLFYRNTGNERYLDKLNQTIVLINEKIYCGKETMVSYCSGIAGYAWLILYLKEIDVIEVEIDDYLSDIDTVLLHHLKSMIEKKQFDSLHNAVGIGFYFLKRGRFAIVESIIDGLYGDRIDLYGYLTWSRINTQNNKEIIDFGLAHGIPGTLLFLYKCYLHHVSPAKCSEMIMDNISLMLNYINFSGFPSFFPSVIEIDKLLGYDSSQNVSRLAWCYEDLTALYVLLHLSQSFPIKTDITNMLENVAQRRFYAETLVNDAGFCHGASGIAHIFNRLYLQTDNTVFGESRNYWIFQG